MKERLLDAKQRINNARNELVLGVISLQRCDDSFTLTISKLKETIGDLSVAEKLFEINLNL